MFSFLWQEEVDASFASQYLGNGTVHGCANLGLGMHPDASWNGWTHLCSLPFEKLRNSKSDRHEMTWWIWWIGKCFGCSSWHQKGVQWWCCPTKSSSRAATQTWRAPLRKKSVIGSGQGKNDTKNLMAKIAEDCFVFQHFLPSLFLSWNSNRMTYLSWGLPVKGVMASARGPIPWSRGRCWGNIWLGSTWEIQGVGTWSWRSWRCFTSKVHVEQSSFQLKIDMVANRHANRHANPCLEMYNALPSINAVPAGGPSTAAVA